MLSKVLILIWLLRSSLAGSDQFIVVIIFENEILPSSDTPETAKLTEINYGDKEKCTVYFYSLDEWNSLKNHTVEDESGLHNYFNKYINPSIKKYIKKTGEIIIQKKF